MSTPSSSGRSKAGEANVLSTATNRERSLANRNNGGQVGHGHRGYRYFPAKHSRVVGRIAAAMRIEVLKICKRYVDAP